MPVPVSPVTISWACVSNLDDQATFRARLTLHNAGPQVIAPGWTLYFNACRKIVPGSVAPGFTIDHINGDLFSVSSTLPAWQPGQTFDVTYQGEHWAISATDAPFGFYLVEANGAITDLGDPVIAPFVTREQRHRGPDDVTPLDDAARRFAQNAPLLDASRVGRITPQPVSASFDGGRCLLSAATTITSAAGLHAETALLQAMLDTLPAAASTTRIELAIVDMAAESYTLTITRDLIRIDGASAQGVFYALQTLRQLLDGGSVPTGRVEDAPRFAYRGLMLDVARHFASVETVLRLLDCMALYKLNRFHFHLTDDEGWRFPVPSLPELTDIGARRGVSTDGSICLPPSFGSGADVASSAGTGYYSAADFAVILRHAQALHIDVIPAFNLPGHARAAVVAMRARHDRLRAQGDDAGAAAYLLDDAADRSIYESVQLWHDNVICIALPSVDRFVDTVVAALVTLFRDAGVPLHTIHIGGDEVPNGAWRGSPVCQALMAEQGWTDVDQLRTDFLARCLAILARHGVTAAGWDENAVERHAPSTRFASSGLLAYAWNNAWGVGQEDIAYRLANAGYPVVLANASTLYFDLAQAKDPDEPGYYWAGFVDTRDVYDLVPLDAGVNGGTTAMGVPVSPALLAAMTPLDAAGAARIAGLQGQLWGENARTPARVEYMAAPRLIALAERAWSSDAVRDWTDFANRLGQRVLPQLDATLAYGYRLPPPGVALIDGAIHANVALPGLALHYTVDGSAPTPASPRYAAPIAPVPAGLSIAAFDTRGRQSRTVYLDQQGSIHE